MCIGTHIYVSFLCTRLVCCVQFFYCVSNYVPGPSHYKSIKHSPRFGSKCQQFLVYISSQI
jgi:hypothetical protein